MHHPVPSPPPPPLPHPMNPLWPDALLYNRSRVRGCRTLSWLIGLHQLAPAPPDQYTPWPSLIYRPYLSHLINPRPHPSLQCPSPLKGSGHRCHHHHPIAAPPTHTLATPAGPCDPWPFASFRRLSAAAVNRNPFHMLCPLEYWSQWSTDQQFALLLILYIWTPWALQYEIQSGRHESCNLNFNQDVMSPAIWTSIWVPWVLQSELQSGRYESCNLNFNQGSTSPAIWNSIRTLWVLQSELQSGFHESCNLNFNQDFMSPAIWPSIGRPRVLQSDL